MQSAGFSGQGLRTAYAIAERESSGRPSAFNGNAATGDLSYGLFQINMLGTMGPARRKQFGIASNEALFDPSVNARAAYQMSGGGTDFGPWGLGPNAYRNVAVDMSVVPANLMAAGGRIPWYADGGDFIAHGPQVIGVGEKGQEHVQITPHRRAAAASGSQGGMTVNVSIGSIENHRPGDVAKIIRGEIELALAGVAQEMGGLDHVREEDMLR